ncbi:hypothetical protein ECG_08777 [Echinococcus granulosus]|nr:hypothetical protein ECG_08777 [Echinococcus granulosus]
MSAKTSVKGEGERIRQNLRAEDSPMGSPVQMVEQAVETVKEDELEEERRREARGGAIRILAQVLNDLTERPRSYRREYFGYCAIVQWSINPTVDLRKKGDKENGQFGRMLSILALGQLLDT